MAATASPPVEAGGAGDVDPLLRLSHLGEPLGRVGRGDAVLVAELGHRVPDPLVDRPVGHFTAVEVDDRHPEEEGRGHDVEQLPPVAEDDDGVGPDLGEHPAGGGGEQRPLLELGRGRHLAHRLGEGVDAGTRAGRLG